VVEGGVVGRWGEGQVSRDGQRPIEDAIAREALTARRSVVLGEDDLTGGVVETPGGPREAGIRALCYLPLVAGGHALGVLSVGSSQPGAFTPAIVTVMEAVANRVALAVANAVAFQKIAQLKDKLAEDPLYLESDIPTHLNSHQ